MVTRGNTLHLPYDTNSCIVIWLAVSVSGGGGGAQTRVHTHTHCPPYLWCGPNRNGSVTEVTMLRAAAP